MQHRVTVYGAYGHTGRFVVAELVKRGWMPVLVGRNPVKLAELGSHYPGLALRVASTDDPISLDQALAGSAAVINCAGPFAETAPPIIDAALRSKIHYLDVAAEIETNQDTLANYKDRARDAGIIVLPAMAFFGGLGDLLATAAVGDWPMVDEISIAYGLSSWRPTQGTRTAGQVSRQRRGGRRVVFSNGHLEYRDQPAPAGEWTFPAPLGTQPVATEFTMADAVTIPHHIPVKDINSFMTSCAVSELVDPASEPPAADDESGRSSQTFMVDVFVRSNGETRRISASGRDIYAVTAPLVAEALGRLLDGSARPAGVYTAGQIFDAGEFLQSLAAELRVAA
jgi:short subunit dehydrogenase-like uncharacterized protein